MDPIYWHTFIKRPYVFLFFLSWFSLALRHLGLKLTLKFLVCGFVIAWGSEALSIRTGFPYGWYFYRYENLQNEWLLAGVPVWDSLSYVFLTYAGLCMALWFSPSNKVKLALLTGLFTTFLDVIIDPVAHQGSKWFLGDIYYYPHPGIYFNVPVSNFLGWFLVTSTIAFASLYGRKPEELASPSAIRLGAAFYFAIALFNVGITLYIRDFTLALVDLVWLGVLGALFLRARSPNLHQVGPS